jgi:hypothetical protein
MAGRVAVRRGRSRPGLATQRKVCNTRAGEKSPALRVYWKLDRALERSAFHHAAVRADGAGDGGRTDVIRVTAAPGLALAPETSFNKPPRTDRLLCRRDYAISTIMIEWSEIPASRSACE